LILSAVCVSAVNLSAQDFKNVRDGVEYAELTRTIDGQPVRMNLLRLDLKKVRLDVVHALDMAIGTETVSSMAKRHGAFAAINGGFFRLDNSIWAGDPAGTLQIDGKLLSESINNRVGLAIWNDLDSTSVALGHLNLNYTVAMSQRRQFVTNLRLSGVNRERKDDDIVLFTAEFYRTTLTNDGGLELIFGNKTVEHNQSGNSVIPSNGFVLSAGKNRVQELLPVGNKKVALALIVPVSVVDLPNEPQEAYMTGLAKVEDIVSGVPQLIKNGKIDITWLEEKASKSFVETRHPRTAVAKLKDGKFLMITVDGRSESSGGIGLYGLAALLLELGATDAMNLDGGGSTTMYLDGKIVNKPSDKEGERKVSDAIIVTLRNKSQK
jgi:exopolysaccharide biosynthesis protein